MGGRRQLPPKRKKRQKDLKGNRKGHYTLITAILREASKFNTMF